jgi:hypothetical protein
VDNFGASSQTFVGTNVMAKTSKNAKPTKQDNEKLKKTAETRKRASQTRANHAQEGDETVNQARAT